MLVETLANLPNSHVKTRKKAHSTRQKKKSKSPGKISKITSAMFEDFDREGFEPEIDFRAYKEQRALDNLRSLNDEFDSGSFKLEDEIQKFTKNFHLDVPQRVMHRNTSCNIIMNHPDQLPIETEPALNRSKSGLVKLPILSILKRTVTSQDDKVSRKAIDTSKNYCDTDQTKTVETQDETYMKTAQNFSQLMAQNVIESHKELVTTGRVKNFAKGTTRQSRSRAVSKNVKEEIEHAQEAKYSSVSPARGTDASTLVKEDGIIHQMQKNGLNVPNIGRRYTIKGLLKREKIPVESLTLKTESVLITDGPQQGSHDSPQNRLRTRGYLNTTKEEFFKGEERYIQGIAKVVQVRQASQPYRSKRESIILEDDSQLRNTYFRARAETRDIGKSTDRESLIIKGPKVEETKETKEIMKDFSHKALKPPVLSEIRENMSMQGFNIFKSSQPTKEIKDTKDNNKDKAKDANLNSLISAPTTTRIPEEEAKQAKAAHARSKSSLYKTKIIMKGPSLLCILGSDKEAKFKDSKKNPESKSSGDFIVKQSVGIPAQLLSYLNDEGLEFRNQSMVTKTRGKPVEGNINRSSIFEEANFFQKRTTPPPDTTPFEREVSPHSPLLEAKKEMRLTYTPKRSLKPLHLCNKAGGLMI